MCTQIVEHCPSDGLGGAAPTAATKQPPPQPATKQPQAAAAYYESSSEARWSAHPTRTNPKPLTLYFPTRYLSDCEEWSRSPAQCGSLTFPDGVYEALDEAVEETVRENIWGAMW